MPTQSEKRQLANRAKTILRGLRTWNTEEIVRAVSRMLSCFEQYLHETGNEKREVASRKIAAKWALELQAAKIPSWAIERACDAVREGRAGDVSKDFPPSIPRITALAESYCTEHRAELDKITDALKGEPFLEPPSPEEKERVKAKLRTFADELKADIAAQDTKVRRQGRTPAPPNNDVILAEYRARGMAPVMAGGVLVSPSLLAKLGKPLKGRARAQGRA